MTKWEVPIAQRFFSLLYNPYEFCKFGGGGYVEKENGLDVTVCYEHFVLQGAYLPKRILSSKNLVFEDRCQ